MPNSTYPGAGAVAYLDAESQRVADICTSCGDCVRACPMTAYAPTVSQADPSDVVHGVLDLLRGGPATQPALDWIAACTRSALCTDACREEGIDPAFMMRLAKMRAMGALREPQRIPVKEDAQFSPRVKAFARLTLSPEEQEGMAVTAETEPSERAIFWYGCNMARHGELIRNSARLLEAVGIAAAPAGGPSHCCGSPKEASARIAGGMGQRTVEKFNARDTPSVITWCPSCHMNMQDFMAPVTAPNFATSHISEILHERRERLRPLLTRPVAARVLIHMHNGFDRRVPVNTIVPELLRMIPGLSVVDHPMRAPGHMCSALGAIPGALANAQREVLDAVAETGADTIATIFHSCHREFVTLERHRAVRVVNWVHLLADSMGWTCEDEYKAWRNAEDPRTAIGEERIEHAGEVPFARLTEPELLRPPPV